MRQNLILGTAGHIDHGKTSLVRALTGVDTDRLPEEKKRGITIQLGFAQLELGDLCLGIVDVPGHERFVRNMLSGATSIDLAMLVVAADDSVKPQTREHLEILKLLNLSTGVIALSKCDVADADWIDLVEAEIRELVAGTFLADAPIIRTSAHTKSGLDELREALAKAANSIAEAEVSESDGSAKFTEPFRLAIDRVFSVPGHGTVVTGSVQSGCARVGDEVTLEPGRHMARIRGLQNHDTPVDAVERGQRAAINLAGMTHVLIKNSHEVATPGHLVGSQLLSVKIRLVKSASRPLKNRSRVRVHLGAVEAIGSVVLLDRSELVPGESALAQIYLSEPVVATWNQPLVLRNESPIATIGGGNVLDPTAAKIRLSEQEKIKRLDGLAAEDRLTRCSTALYFAGWNGWRPADLSRTAGIRDVESATEELAREGLLREIRLSPTRTMQLHTDTLEELCQRFERTLFDLHQARPLERAMAKSLLWDRYKYLREIALFDAVLAEMAGSKRIELSPRGITLAGQGPELSKAQQKLLDEIIEQHRQAGLQPPLVAEIQKQAVKNQSAVPKLCKLGVAEGSLVDVDAPFYLHQEAYDQMLATLRKGFKENSGMTLSEIRQQLGTSRKFAVPLCEHLDAIGFTRRDGDKRILVEVEVEGLETRKQ